MATAFSYSGTGLESAIATGSGGLSSTATSVEVDSIPSDLSAGDTVKAAIGTATNFANGNGEVAHGDVGTIGGGANGGTNITGLSRGQEGTTASSFSEGDPVRVGVQGRDDAGPERSLLQSQVVKPSSNVVAYDDFEGPDVADVNGYTLPSGQSVTVQSGGAEISDGVLRATTTEAIVTITLASDNPMTICSDIFLTDVFEAGAQGIVFDYTDNNNFAYFTIERGFSEAFSKLRLVENNGGTRTQLSSSSALSTLDLQNVLTSLRITRKIGEAASGRVFGANTSNKPSNTTSTKKVGFILNQTDTHINNLFIYQP
ncbi:hypothetical protein [Salinibacter phage B2_17]